MKWLKEKVIGAWQWTKRVTKKTLISIGLIGVTLAAPVVPQYDYVVRTVPVTEGHFEFRDEFTPGTEMKEAREVGRACYNEFTPLNKNRKKIREKIDCDEYWRIAKTPNYQAPFKNGYVWHGYETMAFDTPSGDLEEGYFYKEYVGQESVGSLLVDRASAAIAFDAASDGGTIAIACSDSWSHTTTSTADTIMILAAFGEDSTTADEILDSATYNGVSLTSSTTRTGASASVQFWYLVAPATGANTVSVTFCSSGSLGAGGAGVSTFTGVDQSTPIDATTSSTFLNTANPSITLGTVADNSWVTALIANENGTGTCDANADQTERYAIAPTGVQGVFSDTGPKTPAGNQVMSWTGSGSFCSTMDGTIIALSFMPVQSQLSPAGQKPIFFIPAEDE